MFSCLKIATIPKKTAASRRKQLWKQKVKTNVVVCLRSKTIDGDELQEQVRQDQQEGWLKALEQRQR